MLKNKQLLTGGILLFSFFANAQQERVLKGYLGVEGGESFDFKLVFKDSAGTLRGYSYTWLEQDRQVKASIAGTLDRTNKTLSFRETAIVSNTGFQSNATICLIKATLSYQDNDGQRVFSGSITSSDITNVTCARGSITISNNDVLSTLFAAAANPDTLKPLPPTPARKAAKPMKIVYDTLAPAVKPMLRASLPDKITAGIEKVYEWHSDKVLLELWDGGQEDGDVISVLYNNEILLNKYTIRKNRKLLELALKGSDISTITILAHSEGNEPPNTADILLRDGTKEYHIIAYNTIGKKAIIKIRKLK